MYNCFYTELQAFKELNKFINGPTKINKNTKIIKKFNDKYYRKYGKTFKFYFIPDYNIDITLLFLYNKIFIHYYKINNILYYKKHNNLVYIYNNDIFKFIEYDFLFEYNYAIEKDNYTYFWGINGLLNKKNKFINNDSLTIFNKIIYINEDEYGQNCMYFITISYMNNFKIFNKHFDCKCNKLCFYYDSLYIRNYKLIF